MLLYLSLTKRIKSILSCHNLIFFLFGLQVLNMMNFSTAFTQQWGRLKQSSVKDRVEVTNVALALVFVTFCNVKSNIL